MRRYALTTLTITIFTALNFTSTANAALISRLSGAAYYDTVSDLTWLTDANAAAGTIYDDGASSTDGRLTWGSAMAWAASLNVNGVTGWRLPSTIDDGANGISMPTGPLGQYQGIDAGYNISVHSEMSNLFYNVLGNTAAWDTNGQKTSCGYTGNCFSQPNPFASVGLTPGYWSGTEYAPATNYAWGFVMGIGYQGTARKTADELYVWAVHSGDVAPVPVPSALWLFGSGIIGIFTCWKAKKHQIGQRV